MNERMLELYKQAHIPHTRIDPSNNMPYESTIFSADKFAELIVRECAAMTRNLSAHGELAEKAVKEHFGVEK